MELRKGFTKWGKEYAKFMMIPAAFCGTVFTILTGLTAYTDFEIPIEFFKIIQNPFFITGIGILSFVYITRFYTEHLNSKSKIEWIRKIHKPFTIFAGFFAAFSIYLLPQFGLLFHTVASQTDFDLSTITATIGPFEVPAI